MKSVWKSSLVLLAVLSSLQLPAQEMMLLNDTIEWTMESGHGYYFFQRPAGTPSNWLTPYDYYHGKFYTRYEIISEATDEPCGLQFGIWQWRLESNIQDEEKDYSEIMAEIIPMDGPGSIETNNSSPPAWWKSYEGVDFARVNDFWRLGINIWSLDPRSVIANNNWGGSNELWAVRSKWFPIRVYVTVVAVANGTTFSGWDNYTSTVPPKPAYTINFAGETTNEVVPPTDEYSLSGDMSGAISGSNSVVPLTPGQDLYFRTKAEGGTPASGIQQLPVPSRPPKPAFTYDALNERTVQTVSSEYEYGSDPAMTDATSGTGTYVNFPIGSTRYFRKKATSSAFRSDVQDLTGSSLLPPAYEIDFQNERTKTPLSVSDEYSYDNFSTAGITGTGAYLDLTPGQDVYIRTKAEGSNPPSNIQILTVPQRPAAPSFEVDYPAETVSSPVDATIEYKQSGETVWVTGNGEAPVVIPGEAFIFRKKATSGSFRSGEFVLDVPERPEAPGFMIDFSSERTSAPVPATIQYADNPDMTGSLPGPGAALQVIPGEDIYLMHPATGSSFQSDIQYLEVPERPSEPSFEVDFENETTSTDVTENVEYSASVSFAVSNSGTNAPLPLTPGSAIYFRVKHTGSSFHSLTQTLSVPPRPLLSTDNAADTITKSHFTVYAIFQMPVTGFDLAGLEVSNGTVTNLRGTYIFDFNVNASNSPVSVRIPANMVIEGNFASDPLIRYFKGSVQSKTEHQEQGFNVFPNPFSDMVTITTGTNAAGPVTITLSDIDGRAVYQSRQEMQGAFLLDLGHLNRGIYLITLKCSGGMVTRILHKAH